MNLNHKSIIARAQSIGSRATTIKGAVKFLLHPRNRDRSPLCPIPGIWEWKTEAWGVGQRTFRQIPNRNGSMYEVTLSRRCAPKPFKTRKEWRDNQTKLLDKEAHRARKPGPFRERLARKIRDQIKRLTTVPLTTIKEITAAADSHHERWVEVEKLKKKASTARINGKYPKFHPCFNSAIQDTIKVRRLSTTASVAREYGAKVVRRGKCWNFSSTYATSSVTHSRGYSNHMRKGGYVRARNFSWVRAFALATPATLFVVIHETERQIHAPDGYHWDKDDLGIRIVHTATGNDYHPASHEMLQFSGMWMVSQIGVMNQLRERRRREDAEKRQSAEQLERRMIMVLSDSTIRVNLDDSRRAGNCIEGSLVFAEKRLRMKRDEILSGRWLVHVNGQDLIQTGDSRAHAAVVQAWERETMVSI